MKRPTLLEILRTALYIGTIGYGGPAILALMKKVIVHEKAWISEEEFMNALSLSQILPGAVGVTLFGYIGHKLRKPWGGILAPFSFVLPAMIAITALAWAYFTYGNLKFVHSIFMGLGALVVALLINATLIMGKSVFPKMDRNSYKGITIAALSFLGITFLHWNVVYIILISGVFGALFFYFSGEFEQEKMPGHLKVEIDVPKAGRLQNYLPLLIMAGRACHNLLVYYRNMDHFCDLPEDWRISLRRWLYRYTTDSTCRRRWNALVESDSLSRRYCPGANYTGSGVYHSHVYRLQGERHHRRTGCHHRHFYTFACGHHPCWTRACKNKKFEDRQGYY